MSSPDTDNGSFHISIAQRMLKWMRQHERRVAAEKRAQDGTSVFWPSAPLCCLARMVALEDERLIRSQISHIMIQWRQEMGLQLDNPNIWCNPAVWKSRGVLR